MHYHVHSAEKDAETIMMQSRTRHFMRLRICATYGCNSYGDHNEKRCNSSSDSECRPVQSSDMTIIVRLAAWIDRGRNAGQILDLIVDPPVPTNGMNEI